MNGSKPNISVIDPIAPAIDRVKFLLFSPFDLRKWFVMGFCAWLAGLGEGGSSGGFNYAGGGDGGRGRGGGSIHHEMEKAWDFLVANLYWIIPVTIAVVTLVIGLWVLMVWISSRGRFMFVHCVALDRAEVAVPWSRYAREGNSLFWFRIVLGLIAWAVFLVPIAAGGASAVLMINAGHVTVPGVFTAVAAVLCLIAIGIVFAVIAKFTKDLVVPIMYLRRLSCRDGWRELLVLMKGRIGEMALYILFQIMMAIVLGMAVFLVVIVTCCIAGCLFAIPYVGAVALLPVSSFKLSYALKYLAQFGPEWDAFLPAAQKSNPPQAGGVPIV